MPNDPICHLQHNGLFYLHLDCRPSSIAMISSNARASTPTAPHRLNIYSGEILVILLLAGVVEYLQYQQKNH
ncbi:hypothetical protein BJX68DRAFT_207845 [Aspergillus pseudodeflectus]|uniref:Uncharacterized protein n=1 Tax=Aspergillus pseudodeflectus TaxID=176178 RepID=A0ABR4KYL1_9EURO